MIKKLCNDLYSYRQLLKSNVKKEIRGKYKGSFLGVLWSFVNPLLQVLVYAIVFPYIMRVKEDNYLIYLVTGIIPWTFFITVINQGMITVRMNGSIIKKVYFPREILPISVAVSGLVNFLISCIVVLLFCVFGGVGISWHLIFFPIIAGLQFLFVLGLTFIFSAINVYVKDVEYIVQFLINMLFYATPVLYSVTLFPEKFRWILYLNPMTEILVSYRDIFLYHNIPNLQGLLYVFIVSLILFFGGLEIFKKLQKGFAEEL